MSDAVRPLADQLEFVTSRCAVTLASPEFAAIAKIAAGLGIAAPQVSNLVAQTAQAGIPLAQWERLAEACGKQGIRENSYALQRFILLAAGIGNLERIPGLRVTEEVKTRLLDQFLYVCAPDREMEQLLNPRHYGFRVMCKFMRLERFPAGQSDWEISGFPRSYLARIPLRDVPKTLHYVFFHAGGRRPFLETHTAFRRELPILTEDDERTVFRLLGGSMKRQPEIRGYMGSSWFADPTLAEVSPHLAWLRKWYEECVSFGALWTDLGEAPPDSGFLVGDRHRRRLYQSGRWKPKQGLIIWERRDLLRWFDQHYGC